MNRAWIGIMCGLLAGTAHAQQEDELPDMSRAVTAIAERFYVSPMFAYTKSDSSRQVSNSKSWAISLGKQLGPKFSAELHTYHSEFDPDRGSGWIDQEGYGLAGLVFPLAGAPNLFALGGLQLVKDQRLSSAFGADVGLGYLLGPVAVLNHASLRAEVRMRNTFADKAEGPESASDFNELVLNLGLLIPLGSAPRLPDPKPVRMVPAVTPPDSDGDGASDDLDQCPGTAAETKVDAKGCPSAP